jgi:hypothetical protein
MTIEVKSPYEPAEAVRITLDGTCLHNRVTSEKVEDDAGNISEELFCEDCGAMYNDLDDGWIG